jgi:hypothetical protein
MGTADCRSRETPAPTRKIALVSFNPLAAPIRNPATIRRRPRAPFSLSLNISAMPASMSGVVRMSAKLVPTSDSAIGLKAAMTSAAISEDASAARPSSTRVTQ